MGCSGLTSVNIPNSVNSIGSGAFRGCSSLISVNISNSLTNISNSAFYGCSALESVIIPNSVTSIGDWAFYDCSGLASIYIPKSVSSIGQQAFSRCSGLTSLEINCKEINSWFAGLSSIKEIVIGNGVTFINDYSFYGCNNVEKLIYAEGCTKAMSTGLVSVSEVILPQTLMDISDNAFSNFKNLKTISIPKSVTTIGEKAFYNCNSLTNINIPNSVTRIGQQAYDGCSGISSISIPNSLTNIALGVFSGCSGLTNVAIPNSVISIGNYAFSGCRSLASINIPRSVKSIGDFAFFDCNNLKKVIVQDIAAWCNISFYNHERNICNNPLVYANHLYSDEYTEIKDLIIPNSVTSIGSGAFCGCSSLTTITIPNSVSNVGLAAFSDCYSLTSIEIPSSVTIIENNAFAGCSNLHSVILHSSNVFLSQNAFERCQNVGNLIYAEGCINAISTGLTSVSEVSLPETIKTINEKAFCDFHNLKEIIIPKSVTDIGQQAFDGCTGLNSVTVFSNNVSLSGVFPDSKNVEKLTYGNGCIIAMSTGLTSVNEVNLPPTLKTINEKAFYGFTKLKAITIPQSVTSIGQQAFSGCTDLRSVTIYSNNLSLSGVFPDSKSVEKLIYGEGCTKAVSTGLTSVSEVSLPQTLQTIETNTFCNFSNLKSVTIPTSVTAIGDYAFYGCKSMTNISIPKSIANIPQSAFEGCTSLARVGDLSSCTSIGSRAFYGCNNLTNVGELSSCTNIGSSAFEDCSSLNSLTLSNNLTSIGSKAFDGCSGLRSVTVCSDNLSLSDAFPDSKSVEKLVFANSCTKAISTGLTSVSEVSLPPTLHTIDANAFYNFKNLTTIIIPHSVTSIPQSAFEGCTNLTSIGDISSCTGIGDRAFYGCSSLTNVGELFSCNSFGNSAFYGCSSLTSVTLSSNLVSIGNQAFAGCSGLHSVTICTSNLSLSGVFPDSKNVEKLIYAEGCTKTVSTGLTSVSEVSLPSTLHTIDANAFYNFKNLTTIIIPHSVTSISQSAFEGCTNLTSVGDISSCTSIGDRAFYGCSSLTNVGELFSCNSFGNSAFYGCSSLTSMTLSCNLTKIGNKAFAGCSGLRSVTVCTDNLSLSGMFPDSKNVEKLIYGEGCTKTVSTGLTSVSEVVLPKTLQTIDANTFYNFRNLKEITIPQSVTSIGENAFYGCSNLASVKVLVTDYSDFCTNKIVGLIKSRIGKPVMLIDENGNEIKDFRIPEGVTTVGEYAFCNCSGLTSVLIPSSVTSISQQAFSGCNNVEKLIYDEGCTKTVSTGLTSVSEVVLPKTLQTIDASAFYNFRNLKTITIPQSVTSIGQQAFYGCAALASVTMENNNLTEIYQNAFPSQAKLYVKRGTKTLLTLWKNGYTRPYEIGTDKALPPSSLSVVSTTQMTATIKVNDFYDGYAYTFNDEKIGKDTKTLSVPYPGYKFNQPLKISLDDVLYTTNPYSFQTKGLNMKAERTEGTASSMTVKASYEHGDAPVTAQTLSLGGVTVEDDEIYLNGLKPSASYTVTYVVWINNEYAIRENFKFSTNALQFTASQPKVISEGNVIIASKSNLDDGETNVGFEWRRTDWTSEFPSNRAGAYLYEGMIEGYIRNLNTNYLWKYRPYYETQDGSCYYGDWTGIDPTNTSYFEPTVHTYDKVEVNGNRARVKGYAMRGSDNIVSQGFRYWRSTESASRAKQVEADGQVMSIELKGLDYHTTYRVVAFVTTSEGKTYYGKEQLFTTGDPTGIEETFADEPQKITEEGIYDLSGRKLERMQKGINIIRKADGTTKKVLVK